MRSEENAMIRHRRAHHIASLAALGLALAGCSAADRLANVGRAPTLSSIENPTTQPGWRPVQMPMPTPQPILSNSNSLWRSGSRAFFRDQRAVRVGDIMTVRVRVTDRAQIQNQTRRQRQNSDQMGMPNLFGLENVSAIARTGIDPENLYRTQSSMNSQGQGSVNRSEQLTTNVAAVVTQVLPNGNLVIEGRQEVRVNFEVRELIVAGIVRPEDIESDNTIDSTKIAEARIAYGGRGQITDVQQPRYGQQVMDVLLPF
jgi:flagellar L-ring protein precursor FlgH